MDIDENGFVLVKNLLSQAFVVELIKDLEVMDPNGFKHGIRNAEKKYPTIKRLVNSSLMLSKAKQYLKGKPQVVRVIVFDKTPSRNWSVSWHQDKTIALSGKTDVAGWGPWTIKEGVNHVQPDLQVLENMITFRIHLDVTNEINGCLKVIPASHKLGILTKSELDRVVSDAKEHNCIARPGDLLVMRPHLLHASSKGSKPTHRRVVHVEYSSFELPKGLDWV